MKTSFMENVKTICVLWTTERKLAECIRELGRLDCQPQASSLVTIRQDILHRIAAIRPMLLD